MTTSSAPAKPISSIERARLHTFYLRHDQVEGCKTLAKWLRESVAVVSAQTLADELGINVQSLRKFENAEALCHHARAGVYLAWCDAVWTLFKSVGH